MNKRVLLYLYIHFLINKYIIYIHITFISNIIHLFYVHMCISHKINIDTCLLCFESQRENSHPKISPCSSLAGYPYASIQLLVSLPDGYPTTAGPNIKVQPSGGPCQNHVGCSRMDLVITSRIRNWMWYLIVVMCDLIIWTFPFLKKWSGYLHVLIYGFLLMYHWFKANCFIYI